MTELLKAFCLMFDVDVQNVHDDSEGNRYYDFSNKGGHHVLTLAGEEIATMMDRATGHLPPYPTNTPTHKHYAEFVDTYYVWR